MPFPDADADDFPHKPLGEGSAQPFENPSTLTDLIKEGDRLREALEGAIARLLERHPEIPKESSKASDRE